MSWLSHLLAASCLALTLATAAGAAQPDKARAEPVTPLFHGNWCGAGDADRAPPVDAFDAACRAHDLCYERVGRGACICDQAFLKATAALVKSPGTGEGVRSKAATANSLFSAAPCAEPAKNLRKAANR